MREFKIEDFKEYTNYPMGLCSNYSSASEKENMLAYILSKVIEANDLNFIVKTKHLHPTMVSDGLLEEVDKFRYKLTYKSLVMIYKHQLDRAV